MQICWFAFVVRDCASICTTKMTCKWRISLDCFFGVFSRPISTFSQIYEILVFRKRKVGFPYKPKSFQLCEMLVFNRKRSCPKFAKCYFRYVGFLYKASQICQICFRYKTEYSQICERLVFSTKPNICPSFAKVFFSWRPNLPRFANGWFSLTKRNLPKYGKSWGIYSR